MCMFNIKFYTLSEFFTKILFSEWWLESEVSLAICHLDSNLKIGQKVAKTGVKFNLSLKLEIWLIFGQIRIVVSFSSLEKQLLPFCEFVLQAKTIVVRKLADI